MLYPLKFKPLLQDKIWGGTYLRENCGKQSNSNSIGESWEISAMDNYESVVSNGYLAGQTIAELTEKYGEKLLGKSVYQRFGSNFPLLFKFIDAKQNLSIQVHPNDKIAARNHNASGKTEMWYVLDAEQDSKLIVGLNDDCTKEQYLAALANNTLENLLQKIEVKKGDMLFISAGLIHAIGKGIVVAEIQQSSDITYRIYDYQRKDKNGNERELHTELALEAINFEACRNPKINYTIDKNNISSIIKSQFFTVNLLNFNEKITRQYSSIDSFRVYMCVDGKCRLIFDGGTSELTTGESILIPADIANIDFEPQSETTLLETYI